jgi:dienelactone hydrolase
VIARAFHSWERRLASAATDRVARPFEWGVEWLEGELIPGGDPREALQTWGDRTVARGNEFFHVEAATDYTLHGDLLTFTSAVETPHPGNNIVRARYFPDGSTKGRRRAVLVLPQWNSDVEGHVALCRLLNRFGITALRLSLPYHDARMPPELTRADYIVSSNVARTVQVCRQAVLDTRRAIDWLTAQGFERIGILGTSLGSCLAMLTSAHEPRIRAQALNHVSPWFADVVWRGLSTRHVREGFNGHIELDRLRSLWRPISPFSYLDRVRAKTLLVYARYDLTFPVDLSEHLVTEFTRRGLAHQVTALPCGHYSSGVAPFKFIDGYVLTKFLRANL